MMMKDDDTLLAPIGYRPIAADVQRIHTSYIF